MGEVINELLVFITHGAVNQLADRKEKQHLNSEEAKIGRMSLKLRTTILEMVVGTS